jgi:hypothetical protein
MIFMVDPSSVSAEPLPRVASTPDRKKPPVEPPGPGEPPVKPPGPQEPPVEPPDPDEPPVKPPNPDDPPPMRSAARAMAG